MSTAPQELLAGTGVLSQGTSQGCGWQIGGKQLPLGAALAPELQGPEQPAQITEQLAGREQLSTVPVLCRGAKMIRAPCTG